jgi:MYXO-CTERM domain-containing protein
MIIGARELSSRFPLLVVSLSLATLICLMPARADAYGSWSAGCQTCHGDFNSGTYVSKKDGSSWGTNLMNGHVDKIIGGTGGARCDVCHFGNGKSPVPLNKSNGAGSLPAIGCVGCHGRSQDNTASNPAGYGAGLRQHHHRNAVTVCASCHADANPASFTPVGEHVLPPYYGNTSFPLIPTNSCNPSNTEHRIASALGLDNDGDDVYDQLDSDCACTPTTCAAQGKSCGSIPDGCGGTLDCGTCGGSEICAANVCVLVDAGSDAADAAWSDAASDAPADAAEDAAADAGEDAAADASEDAAADAGEDAAGDAQPDAAADAGLDGSSDAAADTAAPDAPIGDAGGVDAADASSGSPAAADDGGCGCRVAGSRQSSSQLYRLLAVLALLGAAARRRGGTPKA